MNSTSSHQRRSSRSNSTSSSVVTVKKAASLSSRSGSRTPHLKARAPSPEQQQFTYMIAHSSGRPNQSRSRPSSAAENKSLPVNANINRWSQSTTSSTTAIDIEQARDQQSSPIRRMSVSQIQAVSPVATSKPAPALDVDRPPRSRQSPKASPRRQEPPDSRLPPKPPRLNTLPISSYSYGGRSPNTPSTAIDTPLTAELLAMSTPSDYFGDKWTDRSPEVVKRGTDSNKTVPVQYSTTSPPGKLGLSQTGNIGIATTSRRPPSPSRIGHARHREASTKGSTDTAAGSSFSSTRSDQSRSRGHRSPTQKTMLSKALSKANTAVLLDNAQNFEGAIEAYTEACELLQQVMLRSSDFDDRKKLAAIRTTYSTRIAELRELDEPVFHHTEKELPLMPLDEEIRDAYYEEEMPITALDHSRMVNGVNIPPRLESMLPTLGEGASAALPISRYRMEASSFGPSSTKSKPANIQTNLMPPMQTEFLPSPLSPRRPPSPQTPQTLDSDSADTPVAYSQPTSQHTRDTSSESTSWLDTIDESASSTSSSRLSSLDFRPSVRSNLVDEIEAEFDAALNAAVDAAVDAAYLDDPNLDPSRQRLIFENQEESRSEAYLAQATDHTRQPDIQDMTYSGIQSRLDEQHGSTESYLDDEAEEEERLLDEMTRGYVFDDFNFDKRSKSALPRQSDSSGFSGRTWGSSVASTTLTSGTTLSTLAEATEKTPKPKLPPILPPPEGALPMPPVPPKDSRIPPVPVLPPPSKTVSRSPSLEKSVGSGVRDRRLSGQNAKQLKIETNRRASTSSQGSRIQPVVPLPTIQVPTLTEQIMPSITLQGLIGPSSTSTLVTAPLTPLTSVHSGDSLASESPATSALTHGGSQGSVDETNTVPVSPTQPGKMMPPPQTAIGKNMSSSSLKMRNLSVTTAEISDSPITPGSASFMPDGRRAYPGGIPAVPTPTGNTFTVTGQSIGGMYLFDDHIGTPNTPRSPRTPNNLPINAPASLEACPESYLLRPFWLMRCLYQTIAHPRGGYVTTKLFLPRDIWRVKNVKLKAIDEKISQCDLLTAALLKIAKVDNLDADAVLEELQSFESVIEQVRTFLQKKLGGDVGLSGSSSLFKGSPSTEGPPEALESKGSNTSNTAAKTLASSWRKLRSKSSGAAINNSYSSLANKDPAAGSGLSMPTLPMTSSASPTSSRHTIRRIPPTAISLGNMGPNANYMASIARLFDAVQVIDQVARQVEDPGLKCSSKTHVGLELSVRNAAEFFAFYVLRFVLADIGVLLDKFVKRGSEWVLA